MSAWKLLYQGMVVSPVVLLGYIGLGVRAQKTTFEFPHYTAPQNEAIGEYVELMKLVEAIPSTCEDSLDRAAIRHAAGVWANKELRGKLCLIPPHEPLEMGGSVVRDQVNTAQIRVLWALMKLSAVEKSEHHYDNAAKDLATAVIISRTNKSSNLVSISQGSRREYNLIRSLLTLEPNLSAKTRKVIGLKLVISKDRGEDTLGYLHAFSESVSTDTKMHRNVRLAFYRTNKSYRDRFFQNAWYNTQLQTTIYNRFLDKFHVNSPRLSMSTETTTKPTQERRRLLAQNRTALNQ